jgi:diguanylate cyclase (GGDEF)-like protein
MQQESVGGKKQRFHHQILKNVKIQQWGKSRLLWASGLTYIIILGVLASLLMSKEGAFQIGELSIQKLNIVSIIAQFQLLISIYLVLRFAKKGLFLAVILNGYGMIVTIFAVFGAENMGAVPGISFYMGSMAIIQVIHKYSKKLDFKMIQVSKQKEELNYMAFFDLLTGLPNRKMLFKEIETLLKKNNNKKFYVIFIDLDNFKNVNDCMGHAVGDLLLKMVVEKWQDKICDGDILARLGGDEFALIVSKELTKQEVMEYIERFKEVFSSKFQLKNRNISISASFGIANYPEDGQSASELLKAADIAMYQVKRESKNGIAFFSKEVEKDFIRHIQIEEGLEEAIEKGELSLVFQPQYTIDNPTIRGIEALLRWDSNVLGRVSPKEFIPVAEESGLIVSIGKWVLNEAMRLYTQVENSKKHNFILAVNVSVAELMSPDFIPYLEKLQETYDFRMHKLELEITESAFTSGTDHVTKVLEMLKQKGVKIALDDFGVGYTSLKYIQMFPLDTLKIDKSFIHHIGEEKDKESLVSIMISMGHYLGMRVVAEGVETAAQMNYLKIKKCDVIQGYFLARPMSIDQIQLMKKGE